jgi:hypothetical protein
MSDKRGGPPRTLRIAMEKLSFVDRPPPEMKAPTRRFLERLYAKENRGLAELIGRDLATFWPYLER